MDTTTFNGMQLIQRKYSSTNQAYPLLSQVILVMKFSNTCGSFKKWSLSFAIAHWIAYDKF